MIFCTLNFGTSLLRYLHIRACGDTSDRYQVAMGNLARRYIGQIRANIILYLCVFYYKNGCFVKHLSYVYQTEVVKIFNI